jgi:hypothetical protein
MRLTPACGEGWRRLSVVLSVLLAIASFSWFVQCSFKNATMAYNLKRVTNVLGAPKLTEALRNT